MSGVDPLDAASIRAHLTADVLAAFDSIDVVAGIDSTNSELLRRRTPDDGIVALFAESQSGGRGRQGRAWNSPPGANLYLSLARCFDGDLARLGGLSLAVGIAVADAMHTLGADRVRVKWPNDLVVVGTGHDAVLRKLGGVLIEGGQQAGRPRAVIGLGLNVRMPGEVAAGIDQPWTDLHAELGSRTPSRNAIAAAVLHALGMALPRFDRDGLAPFLARYAALDALYSATVDATAGGRIETGIADGIADDGALRLRTQAGERLLRAGEVSVRKRPPAQA